jgi:hypothetical protein
VALKPPVGILRTELMEETLHQPVAAGIDRREVAHLTERVGTVAASATGDLYLRQHPLTTFKDSHLHLGHLLLQIDGQEKTCGTTAYHCRSHR